MAIVVDVPYRRTFEVNTSPDKALAYLKDVGTSVPECFPGLEHFEETAPDTYRWLFEKVGYSSYEFQIRLVTTFSAGPNKLEAHPVAEAGASQFRGTWTFVPSGTGTSITFEVQFKVELPMPFFVKAVAGPIAQTELKKLFDRYVDRVAKNLS